MKRLLYFSVMSILTYSLVSCEGKIDNPTPNENEEVSVYFIYNLPTTNGNSMTKATNAEVFSEFYEKINSAELVATNYSLVLTETTTKAKYELNGLWKSHDRLTLRTGTYHVVGSSTASGKNIQDKCSFLFDETIEISTSSNAITLKANYDCYLLIFGADDIASLYNYNGEETKDLFDFKSYKYAFVNDKLYEEGKQATAYIGGKYTNGSEFRCYTENLNCEKGKYYVYSSVTGGFTAPQMDEGGAEGQAIIIPSAVDLGLSVKWAPINIGANKIEDYGNYYAWGETAPKEDYSFSTYKWVANGDGYKLTKYCKWSQYWAGEGEMDGKDTLDPEDDAAYVNWGPHWRMPTVAEFQELLDKCTWEWTYINDVSGWLAISTINSRSIFFPAACHYYGTTIWPGSSVFPPNTWYWTNYTDHFYSACDFDFYNDSEYATHGTMLMRTQDRCKGAPVRAVYQE